MDRDWEQFRKEIEALNGGVLELEELVKLWARQNLMLTRTSQVSPADLQYDFKWTKVNIQHQPPQFSDHSNPPSPKTQILFRSTYTNDSDQEQVNNFRATRTTKSQAELTVHEGVCLPIDGVRVPLPEDVARANAGFPAQLGVCKRERKSWEETLTWSVDTQIKVGAQKSTQASMVVTEKQWSGSFSIVTNISGTIKVVVRNKNTGALVTSGSGTIEQICQAAKDNGLNSQDTGMTITSRGNRGVQFITRGNLNFRYGVEQNVNISEEDNSEEDN